MNGGVDRSEHFDPSMHDANNVGDGLYKYRELASDLIDENEETEDQGDGEA